MRNRHWDRWPAWVMATAVALLVVSTSCTDEPGTPLDQGGDEGDASIEPDRASDIDVDLDLVIDPQQDPTADPDISPDLPDTADLPGDTVDIWTDPDQPADSAGDDSGGPPPCGQITFRYDAGSMVVTTAVVAGTFNGWAPTVEGGGWPMTDPDRDNVWTATRTLDPGRYEYKFVINGQWYHDPDNPDMVLNEFGTYNSVLVIVCDATWLEVVSHASNAATGTIQATVRLGPTTVALDPSSADITLNHEDIESSEWSIAGNDITVQIAGLGDGIHDLRVQAASTEGEESPLILLKFHLDVSTDWRDALLYFAMTDRFRNGDGVNNSVPDVDARTNWSGGDFEGIRLSLEDGYFDDLGVNALWISWPIDNYSGYEDGSRPNEHRCGMSPTSMATTGNRYTAYHGYWSRDLYQVDGHFGTLEDLRDLVDTAHAHGIRVLLDFTANHVHTSSPLYAEHKHDYFNYPDHGGEHICQNVGWDTDPERCWFTSYLADLDYTRPDAITAMVDVAFYWIRETGADGFRVDAVKHINREFIRVLRRRLSEEIELTGIPFYMVGETFTGDTGLIAGFLGDELLHGQFDFPLNYQVLRAFATREIGLAELDTAARGIKTVYGSGIMSNFIGNHDIARFASMAGGDMYCGVWDVTSNIAQGWLYPPGQPDNETAYRLLRLAFTFIMTVPGIPLIYYGDEFGMPGAGDPDNRRMMRFGAQLSTWESQTLQFMRRLGEVRSEHPALRTGAWGSNLWAEADVLAYPRIHAQQTVIVVLNRGSTSRNLNLTVSGLGISNGAVYRDALGDSPTDLTVSGGQINVTVGAYTAAILVPR